MKDISCGHDRKSRPAPGSQPMARSSVSRSSDPRATRDPNSDMPRLRRAAWAYTTRRVGPHVVGLTAEEHAPRAGDLVLARVDAIGHHPGLQLVDGRRRTLFVGDEIVVVYGNRYAPNQFEAVVPKTLGPCQLVAAGGMAAKALSWHSSISKQATRITPLGLLVGAGGKPVNRHDYEQPARLRAAGARHAPGVTAARDRGGGHGHGFREDPDVWLPGARAHHGRPQGGLRQDHRDRRRRRSLVPA